MITNLAHACLGARDLAATEKFYCGCLGMKKKFSFVNKGKLFGLYLETGGGSFLEFFGEDGPPAENTPRIRHLCLETDDIDATAAALKAGGYEVTEKTLGCDQSWQIWTKDPSGTPIEFHQYTSESTQLTGKDCEVEW